MIEIPVDVADVTPAFLTEALRARHHDVTVAEVEVIDAHSGTTGRARLAVRYESRPESVDVPGTVFVKLPPFDEDQRRFVDLVGLGVAEARFYRDLGDEVPVRVPRTWFAEVDADRRYVMVLEDLIAAGCTFPRPRDADLDARTVAIVEGMAALHAQYWETPRFEADLSWIAKRGTGRADGTDQRDSLVQLAYDRLRDRLPPAFARLALYFLDHVREVSALWNSGTMTVVHGDPHLGNLFNDDSSGTVGIGFLDWAMVGRAPGMRDVAYVIGNSIPPDLRRARERAWIDIYRARLADRGVELDASDAWDQYRLFAVYSWLCASTTAAMGTKWQSERIGMGGTERATATIDDLDSVGFLQAHIGP